MRSGARDEESVPLLGSNGTAWADTVANSAIREVDVRLNLRYLLLLALMFAGTSCGTAHVEYETEPLIHPAVFEMVECSLADTISPVVTEISLDAVAANVNQFYKLVTRDSEGWVSYPDEEGRGFQRYRYEPMKAGGYLVRFQSNGGGTLRTTSLIGFKIDNRQIEVDGQEATVRVLRVTSYAMVLPTD